MVYGVNFGSDEWEGWHCLPLRQAYRGSIRLAQILLPKQPRVIMLRKSFIVQRSGEVLGRQIKQGRASSVEDAVATMEVYQNAEVDIDWEQEK